MHSYLPSLMAPTPVLVPYSPCICDFPAPYRNMALCVATPPPCCSPVCLAVCAGQAPYAQSQCQLALHICIMPAYIVGFHILLCVY